ncbi:TetR/AcrR family transcriptional regulator [Sulfidibacter corallicola]|uniref:TetR/AcrR family transcriptional regulator n=1 Tax=Sulfidibacter corallicola TaxID=2818388 RepID=A0A8A4TIY1_SULCO|nr:TetR/AcrR family transcriptional regulator [Sulfidibacter corallicola]QTD49154.1 TetR/AcrR family transcriptional regulator [Sulfidibacter corallicola]
MASTRDRIVEAAIAALARDPAASMAAIAESAGVSRMTIHRQFKNREILIAAIQDALAERSLAIVDEAEQNHEDPRDQLREIVELCASRSNGFQLLMEGAHDHAEHDRETCRFGEMNRKIRAMIQALQERGEIQPDLPIDWVSHSFDGVLFIAWECLRHGSVAPRDIPSLAWRTFSQGVFRRDAPQGPEGPDSGQPKERS